MTVPDGVKPAWIIPTRGGRYLEEAVSQGRAFKGQSWYVEPLRWRDEAHEAFAETGIAKKVTPSLPKALKGFATVDEPTPPGYYVIVGLGGAAVVNHTTLRQSKTGWERIGDLPVVHVGFSDPWSHYRDHAMGQIANLLHLPGYHRTPVPKGTGSKEDKGLRDTLREPRRSTAFAEDTHNELIELAKAYPFGVVSAWVAYVQDRRKLQPTGNELTNLQAELGGAWGAADTCLKADYKDEYPPFRLLLMTAAGEPRLLYASKIDFCTGNGRPRISIPKRADATLTYGAKPWESPETWVGKPELARRTVLSGLEALCKEVDWDDNQNVCAMGSGGVGVNMVEIGHATSGVRVDWLASGTTHIDSFFNPRNDPLVKGSHLLRDAKKPQDEAVALRDIGRRTSGLAIGGLTQAQRENVAYLMVPAEARWRFMQRVYIDDAPGLRQGVLGTNTVALQFDRYPDKDVREDAVKPLPTMGLDSAGNILLLDGNKQFPFAGGSTVPTYHRVILCSGQNPGATGQPATLVKDLAQTGPILGPDDRLVGLALGGGAIRLLGAASTVATPWHTNFTGAGTPLTKLKQFADTIPKQAGFAANLALFALNTLNVAYANGFFTTTAPNYNVNLATEGELTVLLGSPALAQAICDKRKTTANGFQDTEDLITQVWPGGAPPTAAAALKKISYGYGAPTT